MVTFSVSVLLSLHKFPDTLLYSFLLFGIFGIQSGTGTDFPWGSSVIVPSVLDNDPPSGLPYWVYLRSEY
jgi:hypothetical protein